MEFNAIKHLNDKLIFITSIKSQQKVDVTNNKVYNNSSITSFARTVNTVLGYKGTSREDLYNMLDEVFKETIGTIKHHNNKTNPADTTIINALITNLIKAKENVGTEIKTTYSTDKHFIARLESLVQMIDLQLESITNDTISDSELLRSTIA